MATRPDFGPTPVITSASMGASVTSAVTFKHQIPAVNYSFQWTGSPTGTFTVQISNDYAQYPDGSVKTAGNWVTLPLTPSNPTASGSGDIASVDVVTSANSIRLVYTRSSGSGTLNAIITGAVL